MGNVRGCKKNTPYNRGKEVNGAFAHLHTSFLFIFLGSGMKESTFQRRLIRKLKKRFPGCIVLKNDANYIQGIPDLTIFYKDKWATLECKNKKEASHQPNQDYYVKTMSEMSYSAFIYPENEIQVLKDLGMLFNKN